MNPTITATGHAIDALGKAEFYDALLALLGTAAAHDLASLVRYSRNAPPDFVLPRGVTSDAITDYHRYFWQFDPFHVHWSGGGQTGVFRLRNLAKGIGRTRYARDFLAGMPIYDEIAVFLQPIGDASPTLLLDRAARSFIDAEVQRVTALWPLLSGLHAKHIELLMTNGVDASGAALPHDRAIRFVDRHGETIFATETWVKEIAEAKTSADAAKAVESIAGRGACQVALPGGRHLSRIQFSSDFGPAPVGFCDEISLSVQRSASLELPPAMAARLTEREREIAILTLQGYPIQGISKRLSLSPGTIKNHRLSIYRKFDITTERELFTEVVNAVRAKTA
jgi:DNA-binding CsgD family transcriptional regulator